MIERDFDLPLSFIVDGPHDAQATVLLAHGAGVLHGFPLP